MFATRSRRAARPQSTLTVVPFDARGAGIGEIAPTVAIETAPDSETLLVLCAEAERSDPGAAARCLLALDAFRSGYETAGPRTLTTALLAGMEEANAALYDRRASRAIHRPVGIGLTALVVRGADAYVILTGPGQALIVGADGVTALPPLNHYRMLGGEPHEDRAAPVPLGILPEIEPDLFHIDASDGLFAALCVSALGRILHHEDDGPLRQFDPAAAAEYLVSLGARFRLPEAYGVVVSTEGESDASSYLPSPAPPPARRPPSAKHHPQSAPEPVTDVSPGDMPGPPEALPHMRHTPTAMPDVTEEPRWEYLGESDVPAYQGTRGQGRRDWRGRRNSAAWVDPYAMQAGRQLPALPPRAWMLLGAFALTLVLALLVAVVHTITAHQANAATTRELDGIAQARTQALALRDPSAVYEALTNVRAQLDKVAAEGRDTKRVATERQQLTQVMDTVSGVTRVTPRPVSTLSHVEGGPGSHRLILVGEDGKLYLYDRDKNDWGVYALDPASGKPNRLFATGSVANKVPAGDLRGLLWAGGPATTDRTRLFTRAADGSWSERVLPALGEKRPTAMVGLGDALYLLDAGAGLIVRVPLADGSPAKAWTNDAAAAELRTAVDMTSDGQTVWVLLADGRVRGFVGGAPAQLIVPAAIPPVKDATTIATTAASPYLYVAENGQGRILRVRKADGRVVQALRAADGVSPMTAIQSMTVDEGRGALWYVTADGIVTISLPPVGGT